MTLKIFLQSSTSALNLVPTLALTVLNLGTGGRREEPKSSSSGLSPRKHNSLVKRRSEVRKKNWGVIEAIKVFCVTSSTTWLAFSKGKDDGFLVGGGTTYTTRRGKNVCSGINVSTSKEWFQIYNAHILKLTSQK